MQLHECLMTRLKCLLRSKGTCIYVIVRTLDLHGSGKNMRPRDFGTSKVNAIERSTRSWLGGPSRNWHLLKSFAMSSDEFDEYVDEYDGLDFAAIPDLNVLNPPPPIPEVQPSLPARPPSSTSSHYSFDDLDQSLLVELDELESRLIEDAKESTIGALSGIARVQALRLYLLDAWLRRCRILDRKPQ